MSDAGDPLSVNIGVKFKADGDGYIVGVRFYKSALNTGAHVGTLWSSTGTPLGTATFSDESQFGWQQALFPTPIAVNANATYVISYLAPAGHYAGGNRYFVSGGTDSPPLHALGDGVDGPNGVFGYGSTTTFPDQTYQATNYWVDVLYMPGSTHVLSGTITGVGGPNAAVSLTGSSTAATNADASGNYTFSGLGNGAYWVTPAQTGSVFAPGTQQVNLAGEDFAGVNFGTIQNCPCSTIWQSSAIPALVDGGESPIL